MLINCPCTCLLCLLIALLHFIMFLSCLLIVYPFSMQVIEQDEQRQRVIGLLAEGVYREESH